MGQRALQRLVEGGGGGANGEWEKEPGGIERQNIPANINHSTSVVLMFAQRRRRCANIKTTLAQCLVFAGTSYWLAMIEKIPVKASLPTSFPNMLLPPVLNMFIIRASVYV